MRISKKCEYACLALIELSRHYEDSLVQIADIAERNDIPKKFLEQILILLKNAGYIRSYRGARGGYKLSKPPGKITLAEIMRLIDGALAPVDSASVYFYESTPSEQNQALLGIFKDIRNYAASRLEGTTFDTLV